MNDMAKRLVPAPVRALRWRIPWRRRTPAHAAAPATAWVRALRFTLREMAGGEFAFRTPGGLVMRTMTNNFSSFAMAVAGARDPDIWAFVEARLRPGASFVDAGANIGAYTLPASRLVGPAGRVIAFEAHPLTFALLKRNVEENRLSNVTVENRALGDTAGTLRLSFTAANPGETHVAGADEGGVAVPVTTLDEALSRAGTGAVDYLKIDVEGFELPVLRGALRTLRESPGIIVQTELQERHAERYGTTIGDVASLLFGEGLKPHVVERQGTLRTLEGTVRGDVIWLRPAP
jgi:FkbM family methyltransferase